MSITTVWDVSGMTCQGCARTIERVLRSRLPGITEVSADHEAGMVRIASLGALAEGDLRDALTAAGFFLGGEGG